MQPGWTCDVAWQSQACLHVVSLHADMQPLVMLPHKDGPVTTSQLQLLAKAGANGRTCLDELAHEDLADAAHDDDHVHVNHLTRHRLLQLCHTTQWQPIRPLARGCAG